MPTKARRKDQRQLDRSEVLKVMAAESEIRPDILAEFHALGGFTPRVDDIPKHKGPHVSYTRVELAEQGGEKCPFGMGKCEFVHSCTCTTKHSETDCLRMAGTDAHQD